MSSLKSSPIPLFKMKMQEKGMIKDIKEIIVRIEGLPTCLNGQIVNLGDDVKGIIMGFDQDDVLALALGDPRKLKMGREITGVSEPFKIPVSDSMMGRMITALGEPCDNGEPIVATDHIPVFKDSMPITSRARIDEYLPIGTKIVDIFTPISKGQRQLILGDRMTGKTSVAIDAVVNQKGRNVTCIYCCVGKSLSALEKLVGTFNRAGALDHTLLIVATDSAPVGEQYIVPFAAASIAEYLATKGRDVLVVFDDLTKHAWSYRQLSLLLERPPGREAYPGDIFYVQTQLMERAGKFDKKVGGGSVTFLGIAETQQGDLTGYIPSNLSSMCDGQVYLSSVIFSEGFRPAIDITISLSIVGGRTQPQVLKKLSSTLRSDFAKYNEIVKLSKLSSGLSGEAERLVRKGEVTRSVLQQGELEPSPLAANVMLLWAIEKGFLVGKDDDYKKAFVKDIYPFAEQHAQRLIDAINETQDLTVDVSQGLEKLMADYFASLGG